MKSVTIEGTKRTEIGGKFARRLRTEGNVPCVIYSASGDNVHFHAPQLAFRALVYTPDFQLADVQVEGQAYRCILKDKQFDVVTDELSHVDFQELRDDRKVIANLPLKFTGAPAGVKAGGRLEIKMKTLKVRTMPAHLIEAIEVDITNLELNGNMRVQDVVATNMEVMNAPRQPIASIVLTRALKQEANDEKKADTKKK